MFHAFTIYPTRVQWIMKIVGKLWETLEIVLLFENNRFVGGEIHQFTLDLQTVHGTKHLCFLNRDNGSLLLVYSRIYEQN